MKKTFVAILTVIVAMTIGSIILAKTTAKAGTAKYNLKYYNVYAKALAEVDRSSSSGDYWKTTSTLADAKEHAVEPGEKSITMTETSKAAIREFLKDYDFLEWDRFEKTEPMATKIKVEGVRAFYDLESNCIYIDAEKVDQETVTHELLHALTTNYSIMSSVFYEGFTEYLAQQITPTGGGSYLHAYVFAEAYVQAYGLEKALRDYMADTATDDIDEKLGVPGYANNIELCIWSVSRGALDAIPQEVAIEGYYYYVKALGIKPSEKSEYMIKLLPFSNGYKEDAVHYLNSLK